MELSNVITSLKTLHQLNYLKRSGWLLRGVPQDICESVATHCYSAAKAGFHYTQDLPLTTMLLVHDWPEAISGDPTPHDKIDPRIKHQREYEAMQFITKPLPYGDGLMNIWLEYEHKNTPRAQLAHQLDKLDAGVKALFYEHLGFNVSEFYPYTLEKLTDPVLVEIFETLLERNHNLLDSHRIYFKMLAEAATPALDRSG